MAGRTPSKDIIRCLRTIDSLTQGQVTVQDVDASHIEIQISPNSGPYKGGCYNFQINFGDGYPDKAPEVTCHTAIYHPNIDVYDYGVCLNILDDDWQPHFGIDDVIQGLLYLLNYPNLEDPLSPLFDPSYEEREFLSDVADTMRGISPPHTDSNVSYPQFLTPDEPKNTSEARVQETSAESEQVAVLTNIEQRVNDMSVDDSNTAETANVTPSSNDALKSTAMESEIGPAESRSEQTKSYDKDKSLYPCKQQLTPLAAFAWLVYIFNAMDFFVNVFHALCNTYIYVFLTK